MRIWSFHSVEGEAGGGAGITWKSSQGEEREVGAGVSRGDVGSGFIRGDVGSDLFSERSARALRQAAVRAVSATATARCSAPHSTAISKAVAYLHLSSPASYTD